MEATILQFREVGDRDVYNPAVLSLGGELLLAGRVESRANCLDAEIQFFLETEPGVWTPLPDMEPIPLEDPSITVINGEIILAGVEADWDPNDDSVCTGLRMRFFRGRTPQSLTEFASGPEGMKDVRLVELTDGRIGALTRPQGGRFGRGRIGFTILDSLEEISPDRLMEATILDDIIPQDAWGGSNAAYLLEDGDIGVLAHQATRDDIGAHYVATTFRLNPETLAYTAFRTIATRDTFPKGPAKREDLYDVVFPGGLVQNGSDSWILYTGLSDAAVGRTEIRNPFAK